MRSLRKTKTAPKVVKSLFVSDVVLPTKRKTKLDLLGPNEIGTFFIEQSFVLCRQFDLDPYVIEKELKAKDFKNLIKVFKKHFDGIVLFEMS